MWLTIYLVYRELYLKVSSIYFDAYGVYQTLEFQYNLLLTAIIAEICVFGFEAEIFICSLLIVLELPFLHYITHTVSVHVGIFYSH